MTPAEIKAHLLLRGISQAEIARRQGVTRGAIFHIIHGGSSEPRHRAVIADVLQLPYEAVWGEVDPTVGNECQHPTPGN